MSPLAGMMIPHESYSICWEAAEPFLWFTMGKISKGDEWVFRMEMPAIFHKFIVGSRAGGSQQIPGVSPHGLPGEKAVPEPNLF